MQKFFIIAFLLFGMLSLTACVPDMSLLEDEYRPQTIEVPSEAVNPGTSHSEFPPLYCKAGHGSALFGNGWYDFSDTMFILRQGDRANIRISRIRSKDVMTVQALFDNGGQKLIFCPVIDGPPDQSISCASLYALENDLHDGIKRTFDIPDAVRGGMISCAYQQANLKSLATPAAGGN